MADTETRAGREGEDGRVRRPGPDYDLDDTVELTRPDQLHALGNPLRFTILGLLSERAATTSQLADALQRPRGTIGHHLKVLEAAGLVRVVRTRAVRALTEKYYGRVARMSVLVDCADDSGLGRGLALRQALAEITDRPAGADTPSLTIRHARISATTAQAFMARLDELADDFELDAEAGAPVYGFVAGLYETDWPSLPEDAADDERRA